MLRSTLLTFALSAVSTAHVAAWAPGMYCRGGADLSKDDVNTNTAVNPLYNLAKADWWFQHDRGCDKVPPKAGEFLELPANGRVTVELAHNRAKTSLSYNGQFATDWPDGKQHPEDWNGWGTDGTPDVCLKEDGAMHTWNQSSAGGTAFAISYHSNLADVTMENLVVFSTRYHTPWKRLATYDVPNLPACPADGCTCAWLWIPNQCGTQNMYMHGFKCKVTNASPTAKPLAKAQVPVYCENEPNKCVHGAKQMLAWHQASGNNIVTAQGTTPNYNQKCGWAEGAQKDIFVTTAKMARAEDGRVEAEVARPHPWSKVEGRVVRPPPYKRGGESTVEAEVARPPPFSVDAGKVESKVARPPPYRRVEEDKVEAEVARPHPWSKVQGRVVRPPPYKRGGDSTVEAEVARPPPYKRGEGNTVSTNVARPHPWSKTEAKVVRPPPYKCIDDNAVEAEVARPPPYKRAEDNNVNTNVARPLPFRVEDTIEVKAARPHPWRA